MQGLGHPIISFEAGGYRHVAIGSQLRRSKNWKTFTDFLFDHIKFLLTPKWGNDELEMPEAERHPLLLWYKKVCEFQQAAGEKNAQGIYTAAMTGAVRAYLGLAYDLYLCAHNAHVQDLLLKRLRSKPMFEGALYEAHVVGLFAKAGFSIEFEDEGDPTRSHCEFTATHANTGRKFSVEAKAVSSESRRAGSSTEPPRVRRKLSKALKKRADHPRVVFIDLSRADHGDSTSTPIWMETVTADLQQAEGDLLIDGQPAPSAYVFMTNRGFLHALDDTNWSEFDIVAGFKIHDFPPGRGSRSILDAYKARERHIEVHWLYTATDTHRQIPSTFDDRLPEEAFSDELINRPRIGDTHLVPDGQGSNMPGVLIEALVMEHERKIFGQYHLVDGRRILCSFPISEGELTVYRRDPDTFFDVISTVPKGLKTPLDCFDFLAGSYFQTPREKLLEFMTEWPDFSRMKGLTQRELAELYCDRMATNMWAETNSRRSDQPNAADLGKNSAR